VGDPLSWEDGGKTALLHGGGIKVGERWEGGCFCTDRYGDDHEERSRKRDMADISDEARRHANCKTQVGS
jgi:hypothetical protein